MNTEFIVYCNGCYGTVELAYSSEYDEAVCPNCYDTDN